MNIMDNYFFYSTVSRFFQYCVMMIVFGHFALVVCIIHATLAVKATSANFCREYIQSGLIEPSHVIPDKQNNILPP